MELTPELRAFVDNDGATRLLTGGFGSGKTSALIARWQRLAAEHGPARVLFVVRRATAAADVRRRMVKAAAEAGLIAGPLAVTTWTGFALDLVRRHVAGMADASLIAGANQRRLVAEVFGGERSNPEDLWPGSGAVVRRRAFPSQLARAADTYLSSALSESEIAAAADEQGVADRWLDLAAFIARYGAALRDRDAVDASEVVMLAAKALRDDEARASFTERFVEVIIDDAEAMTPATAVLLGAVSHTDAAITLAVNADGLRGRIVNEPIDFAGQFVQARSASVVALPPRAAPPRRLVHCSHPSIEADAVVGELAVAHDAGVPWHEMAVVVPRDGLPISRAVVRALRRRDIPVQVALVDGDAEPIVRHLRALMEDVDPAASVVAALDGVIALALHELAAGRQVDLVAPAPSLDRALDALVAFNQAATRWAEAQPEPTATVAAFLHALDDPDGPLVFDDVGVAEGDGVAVVSVDDAAGRHWAVVIAPGAVEGEYPRIDAAIGWFDPAITTASGPLNLAERRRVAVLEQRRRHGVVASRGERVVFVAAPQPGVLVSRYVQDLDPEKPDTAWLAPTVFQRQPATISTAAMHPSGSMRVSASQLSTYEDCPRRWFYASVLRLEDSSSVWTEFGSLVHNVLERFLAPEATSEYSLEALLELAEEMWSDDIARWKPQRQQAHRELREILERWWGIEGDSFSRDNVVAVEHEFDIAVGNHQVRGRIDRVDLDPFRGGIAVVDYKTGRRFPREGEIEHDLQLAVYYLAALRSEELARIGRPTLLRLLYFRHTKTPFFDQPITEDHEEVAEARINVAAQEMLAEQLEPRVDADCDHCDFHRLCPLQRAGREVGAS